MNKEEGCWMIVIAVILAGLVIFLGYMTYLDTVVTYADATVLNTFVSDGETYITVQLDNGDKEVFSNDDNVFKGKYNSNDLFTELEVGARYHFTLTSKRIPFMSMFRNILEIERLPDIEK